MRPGLVVAPINGSDVRSLKLESVEFFLRTAAMAMAQTGSTLTVEFAALDEGEEEEEQGLLAAQATVQAAEQVAAQAAEQAAAQAAEQAAEQVAAQQRRSQLPARPPARSAEGEIKTYVCTLCRANVPVGSEAAHSEVCFVHLSSPEHKAAAAARPMASTPSVAIAPISVAAPAASTPAPPTLLRRMSGILVGAGTGLNAATPRAPETPAAAGGLLSRIPSMTLSARRPSGQAQAMSSPEARDEWSGT